MLRTTLGFASLFNSNTILSPSLSDSSLKSEIPSITLSCTCFAISFNLSHIDLFPSGSKIIDKNYHNFAWEYDADIRGGASFNHSSWAPVMSDIYWWLKQ